MCVCVCVCVRERGLSASTFDGLSLVSVSLRSFTASGAVHNFFESRAYFDARWVPPCFAMAGRAQLLAG